MTLDDALRELGIDREAGAEGARRAYLRLLKKRKPEVDPEGFMRLREAYELARAMLPMFEAAHEVERRRSVSVDDERPADLGATTQQASTNEEMGSREEAIAEAASESAPASASESAPASASASAPASESAPASASDSDSASASAPASAPDPQVDAAFHATFDTSPTVEQLFSEGKIKKAAAAAKRRYADAANSGEIDASLPRPWTTIRLLLTLHQNDHTKAARALEKAFETWLSRTGLAMRLVQGELAVLWTIERELSALPETFPVEMRETIARAALAGDLAQAKRAAASFRIYQKLLALSAAQELRDYAPQLAAVLADTLDPPALQQQRPADSFRGLWFIIPILFAFIRFCSSAQNHTSRPPSNYDYSKPVKVNVPPPPPPPLDTDNKMPFSVWDLVDASAYEAKDAGPSEVLDAGARAPKNKKTTNPKTNGGAKGP